MVLSDLFRGRAPDTLFGRIGALLDSDAMHLIRALQAGPPRPDSLGARQPDALPGADLWVPTRGRARAALVLTPGLSEHGRGDHRIWQPAAALARCGFLVMVPDLPGALAMTVDPADAVVMARAARALAAHPDNPRPGTVAMIAICCTAAPAVITAAQADSPVRFLLTIGGYFDIAAALTAAITGAYRQEAGRRWHHRPPSAPAIGAFLIAIGLALSDSGDRERAREAGLAIMRRGAADLAACRAAMTPEGQAAIALVQERTPERIPERIAALPEAARIRVAELDPSRADLSGMRGALLALHGTDDDIMPWTESIAMSKAVPHGRAMIVPGLRHIGEESHLSLDAKLKLVAVARALLDWRDGVHATP